jgi:AcrR family transcriptional regulator
MSVKQPGREAESRPAMRREGDGDGPTERTTRRPYASLREEQADATRERILEALVRTMGSGVAALSMPAVAREAAVSIPTIYRHFGSKQGLLDGLSSWVMRRSGLVPQPMPETIEAMGPTVRETFHHLDEMDATLRAAMASDLGREVRRSTMPERLAMHRGVLQRSAPDLPDDVLDRLASLSVILLSSAAYRAYKDYLGLDADRAADLVAWAMRTLVAGASAAGQHQEEG